MAKDSSELLGRVSNLEQEDSSRDIYDDWSQHYDEHLKAELGYIAPGVAAAELAQAELSVATVQQPALAEFINQGNFMSHVRKMGKIFKRRQQFLARFFQKRMGEMATISGTGGGLNIILNLPTEIDDAKLSEKLSATGIIAHPLHDYYLHQNTTSKSRLNGLVIGFACASTHQLEKAAISLIGHLDVIKGD